MSLAPAPRSRVLVRGVAVSAVLAISGLLGAPAASAAPDGRPLIELDPPDVAVFLVPLTGDEVLDRTEGVAVATDVGSAAAPPPEALAVLPPEALAVLPPEALAALPPEALAGPPPGSTPPAGAQGGVTAQTHGADGGVHVRYGGTLDLQLPALVDASGASFTLDVDPLDPEQPARRYTTDPEPPDQPLTVAPLGGNRFAATLPAQLEAYGPAATLTVDGLTHAATGAEPLGPLEYALSFLPSAPVSVDLRPVIAVLSHAECSFAAAESCPAGPTVHAGSPVDLTVPSDSLLTAVGFGRLDGALYGLGPVDDGQPHQFYDSETHPDLVTVHGPRAATLHVPAAARPAPYVGMVLEADPSVGVALTFVQLRVEEVPVNPGLRSDTGWVEEVREVSPGSTAAVAGAALLLVGGLVAVAALRPGRRPPLGG